MWCFGEWGIINLVGGLENVSVDGKSTWVWGVAGEGGPRTWKEGTEHHKRGHRIEKRWSVPGKGVQLAA